MMAGKTFLLPENRPSRRVMNITMVRPSATLGLDARPSDHAKAFESLVERVLYGAVDLVARNAKNSSCLN